MSDGGSSSIHASITGGVSGQVVVGNHNTQYQQLIGASAGISEAERAELAALLDHLRAEAAAAPPEKRKGALERVQELEQEVAAPKPDLNRLDYVKLWFASNVPRLAGLVTGILVHPVVGKIVDGAGAALASEYRERFGITA